MNAHSSLNLTEELRKGEYEAQFFQTSALSLAYSLKELIKDHVQKCLDKLNGTMEHKAANPYEFSKSKEIIQTLTERYKFAIEKHCEEMESKIHEVFNIPSHILLPEDKVQMNQYTKDEEEKLDEEISLLKLRYKRAVCVEGLLKKQIKLNECVDLLEKVTFEIDNNVDTFRKIFEDKEKHLEEIVDELKVCKYLEEVLQSLTT